MQNYVTQIITSDDPDVLQDKLELIRDSQNKWGHRYNFELREPEFEILGQDSDYRVRRAVATKIIPQTLLERLRDDSSVKVRMAALGNPGTDFQTYRNAVLYSDLSSLHKSYLCRSIHAVANVEVFEALWSVEKECDFLLVRTLDEASRYDWSSIDMQVFGFVEEHILGASRYARLAYTQVCGSLPQDPNPWVNPVILDKLKKDCWAQVLASLALNRAAFTLTHIYLVDNYKYIPVIRMNVARITDNNELLNKIYKGTRSQAIQEAVLGNPAFSLLD